jgi:hypothetical protein
MVRRIPDISALIRVVNVRPGAVCLLGAEVALNGGLVGGALLQISGEQPTFDQRYILPRDLLGRQRAKKPRDHNSPKEKMGSFVRGDLAAPVPAGQ